VTDPCALLDEPPPAARDTDRPAPFRLRCERCGEETEVPDDPAESSYRCDCGAATVYGVEMPRVANVPHPEDRRFVVAKISHSKLEVDLALEREYAAGLALDLLSVTNPLAYDLVRAVTAVLAKRAVEEKR